MDNCFACIVTRRDYFASGGLFFDPGLSGRTGGPAEAFRRRFPRAGVVRIGGVCSTYAQTGGWLIAAPLPARGSSGQRENVFRRQFLWAGRRARKLGAPLAGLDLAAVADGGVTAAIAVAILRRLGLAVTTGGSFTVVAVLEGLRAAATLLGQELETIGVVILGATGPLGTACARILAREGIERITLVEKDRFRLDSLAGCILYESGLSCMVTPSAGKAVTRAGAVIVLDGETDCLPEAGDFQPGAVLCDATGSQSLARKVSILRQDVLVTGGAVFEAPGEICSRSYPVRAPLHLTGACLAETMLLALERRFENYSLGSRLRPEKVLEMRRLAAKHGFKPVGLHRFEAGGAGMVLAADLFHS